MRPIAAFSATVETLKRNPVLFATGFLIAFLNTGYVVAQATVSETMQALLSIGSLGLQLVLFFVVTGAYGMVAEGLDGETRLRTLPSVGKKKFGDMLAGTLLLGVVLGISIFAAVIFSFIITFAFGGALGPSPVGTMGLVTLGVFLLGFLPLFFLQFYVPAIIVNDDTPADALKRSYAVVSKNLLSTLGFDAVLLVVLGVVIAPNVWLYTQGWNPILTGPLASSTTVGLGIVAVYAVLSLLVGTVVSTFYYVYHVTFYEACLETDGVQAT